MNPAWTLVLFWRLYVRALQLQRAALESGAPQARHGDHDSRGMFQQRRTTWAS